jgi:hypothetical protein
MSLSFSEELDEFFNKIKLALLWEYITMHDPLNVHFVIAQQAKQTYQYKNIREKSE